MMLNNAVGTITQVLSLLDCTPTPYVSVHRAPENALNNKNALVGNPKPGSLTTQTSSRHQTAQNFRIILRSSRIVKNCPALPV